MISRRVSDISVQKSPSSIRAIASRKGRAARWGGPPSARAAEPTDMVLECNTTAINAIQNPNTPPPPPAPQVARGLGLVPPLAGVNLAIVHAAIYDAVNAIDGTHEPYLLDIHAPADASQAAAAATAAHHVLVGLVPSTLPQVTASLDALYATSLGGRVYRLGR